MYDDMITHLDKVFESVGRVDEVVLLGDVKHEFGRIMRQERGDSDKLIDYLLSRCGKVVVVKGNHDKIINFMIGKNARVEIVDYYIVGEFCFLHGDRDFKEIYDKKIKYWIVGHLHPAIVISDGTKAEKYKCFFVGKYKGKELVIVPSFVEYSAGSDPREEGNNLIWDVKLDNFDVYVVGEDLKSLKFGKLKNI